MEVGHVARPRLKGLYPKLPFHWPLQALDFCCSSARFQDTSAPQKKTEEP